MMVSPLSIVAMVVTLLLSLLLPIILFIIIRRSSKYVTGAVVAGALAFYLSQMLIRLPIIQVVLPKFEWYRQFSHKLVPYIFFLALSAGLFEETARFLAYKLLLREKQVWKCAIAYGIGHGGIEAVLIVGITYINNIVLSIMINTSSFHSFMRNKVDEKMLTGIYEALVETPAGLFLAAGVERMLTIAVHIALSVLILEGIVRKYPLHTYAMAVFSHTAINFSCVYLAYLKVNYWLIELFLAIVAVGALVYVHGSKRRFRDRIEVVDEAHRALEEGY